MDDIVERLRAATHYPLFVHQEAPDEIVSLRAALEDCHNMESRTVEELREEIKQLEATNHLEIVLPPFGHSFPLPANRLDMAALEWMRKNCVIVTREEWEKWVR